MRYYLIFTCDNAKDPSDIWWHFATCIYESDAKAVVRSAISRLNNIWTAIEIRNDSPNGEVYGRYKTLADLED